MKHIVFQLIIQFKYIFTDHLSSSPELWKINIKMLFFNEIRLCKKFGALKKNI